MAVDAGLVEKLAHLQVEEDAILQELDRIRNDRRKILRGDIFNSPAVVSRKKTIDSLPPELLLVIFEAACAFNYNCRGLGNLQGHAPTPISISHVCRIWRSLALGNSALWTNLWIHRARWAGICLSRSGDHLLDAVRTGPIPLDLIHTETKNSRIRSSYPRWRSLSWQFHTNQELKWAFRLLFALPQSEALRKLELHYESRDLNAMRPGATSAFVRPPSRSTPQFPALEELQLCNIHLTELSPCIFSSSLRVLSIDSTDCTAFANNSFTMSRLRGVLRATTGLQVLELENCVPRWDICLITDTDASETSPIPQYGNPRVYMHPIRMPQLRQLSWSFAPPKGLSQLLYALGCFNLEELYVGLDFHDATWPPAVLDRWCTQTVLKPFQLPCLRVLDVASIDAFALTYAVKKLAMPALESFVFSRLEGKTGINHYSKYKSLEVSDSWSPTSMPALESFFHEPRLVNLTRLEVFGCELKRENVGSMLVYMPSLESLTLKSCEGAEAVICALSGARHCCSSQPAIRKWLCPKLTKLVIVDCNGAEFKCLQDTIMVRKRYAEESLPSTSQTLRSIKPLKRKLVAQIDHPVSPFATPPRAKAAYCASNNFDAFSSPNGSFVAGWTAHESIKPLAIDILHVEGCVRITENQLIDLRDQDCGVREVRWHK